MFAVIGGTGKVGRALTQILVSRGKQVRALYRDEKKADSLRDLGAEAVFAPVEDASALECAFQGAEGVFVMTPPFYRSHDPRNENALALAAISHGLRAAHVGKVVFLSSIGAQQDRGTGGILKLHDMEREMFRLSLSAAAIRAAYFMENLVPLLPHAEQTGKLPVVIEPLDRPIQMVAVHDIADAAAGLLVEGWRGQATFELEGPQTYSMLDAAKIAGEVIGRAVTAEMVPREARQRFYEQAGFTSASAATMVEMADGMNAGTVAFEGGNTKHQRGTTPLEDVLRVSA